MSERVLIREYSGLDLDRIFRLDEVCFAAEFRFDRQSMRRFVEVKNAIVLIAEDDAAEISGFVIVHVEGGGGGVRGYVVTLDVAPARRRMGLAGRLMDESERRARLGGAGWMELHVFTRNDAAVRFYEGRGYERVGLRKGFYGGAKEGLDAFVYQKDLR